LAFPVEAIGTSEEQKQRLLGEAAPVCGNGSEAPALRAGLKRQPSCLERGRYPNAHLSSLLRPTIIVLYRRMFAAHSLFNG
jgi:hypothetical protein